MVPRGVFSNNESAKQGPAAELKMPTNLDRYKRDLDALLEKGTLLNVLIERECFPKELEKLKERLGDKADALLKSLPTFIDEYQSWYSEAMALVKQLLPDRLPDLSAITRSRRRVRKSPSKATGSRTVCTG